MNKLLSRALDVVAPRAPEPRHSSASREVTSRPQTARPTQRPDPRATDPVTFLGDQVLDARETAKQYSAAAQDDRLWERFFRERAEQRERLATEYGVLADRLTAARAGV